MAFTALKTLTAGVDPALTGVALGRKISGGQAREELFPNARVPKETGHFVVGGFEAFQPYMSERGVGANANFIDTVLSSDNYDCTENQLAIRIDQREIQAAQGNLNDLLRHKTQMVADAILNTAAVDACTIATTAGNYDASFTGAPAVKWDNSGAAVEDLIVASSAITAAGEGVPNTLLFGMYAWGAWSTNSQVKGVWNDGGKTGLPDIEGLGAIVPGVDRAAVETTVTRAPGGTSALAFTTDACVLARVTRSLPTDAMTSSFGATFESRPLQISTWTEQGGQIVVVSASWIYDIKMLLLNASGDTKAGYLYTAVDT